MLSPRIILLIIDGLGIGEMDDVAETRPMDKGANTLKNVIEKANFEVKIPHLNELGLNLLLEKNEPRKENGPLASLGKSNLKHFGADTFNGHQELMGTVPPKPEKQLMKDIGKKLAADLKNEGLDIKFPLKDKPFLAVNNQIVIHDNMEGEIGQNINVTATMDEVPFSRIEEIGLIIRKYVKVGRVIVVGGKGFDFNDILNSVVEREGRIGVDTPGLGVYDENYMVRHIGLGVEPAGQLPTLAKKNGLRVSLIGKAADVVFCKGAKKLNTINTRQVMEDTLDFYKTTKDELIISNVQETDLAGHEQDPDRYGKLLMEIDRGLEKLIREIREEDILIISADHGNDPTIGHGQHTREMVPILFYKKNFPFTWLGKRESLADVAATISSLLKIDPPKDGLSFFKGGD